MSQQLTQDRSPASRGIRLKKVREMAKMTSDDLAKKAGVTRQSFSSWENASQSGLSSKGAEAVIDALLEQGVYCDFKWLWSGTGTSPYWLSEGITELNITASSSDRRYPLDIRSEEIRVFEQNCLNSVIMEVKHNAMKPVFQQGDWIGGYWRSLSPKLLNQVCIVEREGYLEVRLLKGRTVKGYSLRFMSYPQEAMEPFELVNQNPVRVAPVLRLWRRI